MKQTPKPTIYDDFTTMKHQRNAAPNKSHSTEVMSFDEFKAMKRQVPQKNRSQRSLDRRSNDKSRRSTSSRRSGLSLRNANSMVNVLTKAVTNATSTMATAKAITKSYGSRANDMKTLKSTTAKLSIANNNMARKSLTNHVSTKEPTAKKHPDYITPHNVALTPPRTCAPPTDYMVDPTTPHFIRGAISAGLAGLSEKKPMKGRGDVFLNLPEGMPDVIMWEEGWEIAAGFGKKAQISEPTLENKKTIRTESITGVKTVKADDSANKMVERGSSRILDGVSTAHATLSNGDCQGVSVNKDGDIMEDLYVEEQAFQSGEVPEGQTECDELLGMPESEEEVDPHNASMWVAAEIDEEDTIMNLGDIIVDYDDGFDVENDGETPSSFRTVHIGEVFSFEETEDVVVQVRRDEINEVEESTEKNEELKDSVLKPASSIEAAGVTSPVKNSENLRAENLPFQTPHSVQKGERPLTFTEFKHMNQRVLFDPSVLVKSIQLDSEEDSVNAMGAKPSSPPFSSTVEQHPRYSTDWLFEDNGTPVKIETGKRELKGRVFLLRIGKKISKVTNKGKNVLKQVLVMPALGEKKEEAGKNYANNMALSLPHAFSAPMSPSSISVVSIVSSVMTGASKRIIGAIPVSQNQSPLLGHSYGAIKYTRSATDSTVGDSLPSPPNILPPLEAKESMDEEDAVSFLAAAMKNAGEGEDMIFTEEDAASIMATINAQELDEDEESVILVVTPRENHQESYRVISGFDGATPINVEDVMNYVDDECAIISDLKPKNLQGLLTDKSKKDASFAIMDAKEGIILTPPTVNHNTSNVFRRSTDMLVKNVAPSIRRSTGTPILEPSLEVESLPNLLPESRPESDDEEEDETLFYHDGCTLIQQKSTFGDNTIATADASASDNVADMNKSATPAPATKLMNEVGLLETPILSPDRPSFSEQAAKNGSFLFSENNMGRAAPRIRAQKRALLKQGNIAPSLTMLPPAKSMDSKDVNAIVSRLSCSSAASDLPLGRLSTSSQATHVTSPTPLIAIKPTVELRKSCDDSIKVEIQKKPVFSSINDTHQFSFKATLHKLDIKSTPVEPSGVDSPSALDESNKSKNEESATPLVTNCAQKKKYPTTPFPDSSETNEYNVESCALSPAASIASKSSHKKPSPKQKNLPKSALKTRKGLVKDRISDIQQRIEGSSLVSVTGVGGRLKKNHSYKLKSQRRMTSGDSVLAPKKATLQNPIFAVRSVPIGISKSYSRDEEEDKFRYSNGTLQNGEDKTAFYGEDPSYASKYIPGKNGVSSNCSSPCSDSGSSYISESTECDPFNTLLGKNIDSDEESTSDSLSPPKNNGFFNNHISGKENTNNSLPFKQVALVKPTEINQHDKRIGFTAPKQAPLSRNPMQARSWRQLAAAAKEKDMKV